MKLYELSEQLLELAHAAYDADDAEFAAIQDRFEATKVEALNKLENIGRLMRDMELDCAKLKAEEDRLAAKRETLKGRREWLKLYVGRCLGVGNIAKTDTFTFSWRKSKSVEITDPSAIPSAYVRVKTIREPDKETIGDDLKCGAEIPGARLIEKQHLQIK